jgi:hypothetical protein
MGKHLTMSYGHLAHTGYELYNQGPGNVRRPSTTGYDIRFGQGRWLVSNTGIGKGSVQHCLDFSFVFSAHLPTRRNLFSASGILCSGKYQPRSTGISSLSLLLKSEKIPALLYLGKGPEYRPFWDFLPVPSAYRPQAQISNHGRACTQALPLYELHPTLEANNNGNGRAHSGLRNGRV